MKNGRLLLRRDGSFIFTFRRTLNYSARGDDVDSTLASAIVAAGVSLGIWGLSAVLGPFTEKRIPETKIETEHTYEQKKQIKNAINQCL